MEAAPSDGVIGLTFEEARKRVLSAFRRANESHELSKRSRWSFLDSQMILWLGMNAFVVMLLLVCFGLNQESEFQAGYLVSAVVLVVFLVANCAATLQFKHCSQGELHGTVTSILNQYNAYMEMQGRKMSLQQSATQIPTGHSQHTIVNTFRNGQWIKIPTLLLAEGDIIALMGGDITPCKVFELVPLKDKGQGPAPDAQYQQHWAVGQLINPGVKILINKHSKKPTSKSSRSSKAIEVEKHRSLGPESAEILRLAGDLRCFLLAETPIERFVGAVYQETQRSNTQRTFMDQLLHIVMESGLSAIKVYMTMLLLLVVLRLVVFEDSRYDYVLSALAPFATTLIVLIPVSLPGMFLVAEAMGTAEILSTLEVALHKSDEISSAAPPAAAQAPRSSSVQLQGEPTVGELHPIPEEDHPDGESGDDEFHDEDLDHRAEDIAEETDTKVEYRRFFVYTWTVLLTRLFGASEAASMSAEPDTIGAPKRPPLLPIPLSSMNLVDQLGAITMVCFVDDDVICENYSVTEEIFLLTEKHEGDQEATNTNEQVKTHVKGTVLDLHANPEATGSRFENPLWWKFLPSLKPIGVDALLTYKHTSGKSPAPPPPEAASASAKMTGAAPNKPKSSSRSIIERSLVRHIQQTLPLESLRELAEEIGFQEDDLQCFTRALEINVIASGLEKAHLLEDNHQWGQEESRRRGSLLPQLRGAVYQDARGGLQMMSLGDPTLILNYCREYWDGSTCSITPLSAVDRVEVLSVYERWKLEDFDVTAFCYTPMPVTSLIHFDDSIVPASSKRRPSNPSMVRRDDDEDKKLRTLFFVDPSSVEDLMGKRVKKHGHEHEHEHDRQNSKDPRGSSEAADGNGGESQLTEAAADLQSADLADPADQADQVEADRAESGSLVNFNLEHDMENDDGMTHNIEMHEEGADDGDVGLGMELGTADEDLEDATHVAPGELALQRPPSARRGSQLEGADTTNPLHDEYLTVSLAEQETASNGETWDTILDGPDASLLRSTMKSVKRSASDSNLQASLAFSDGLNGKSSPLANLSANYSSLLSPEPLRGRRGLAEVVGDYYDDADSLFRHTSGKYFSLPRGPSTASRRSSPRADDEGAEGAAVRADGPSPVFSSLHQQFRKALEASLLSKSLTPSPDPTPGPLTKSRSLDRLLDTPSRKSSPMPGSGKFKSLLTGSEVTMLLGDTNGLGGESAAEEADPPARGTRSYSLQHSRHHHHHHHHNGKRDAGTALAHSERTHRHNRDADDGGATTEPRKSKSRWPAAVPSAAHRLQKQQRRTALRQLWSLMRQQIFLGMVASSVPVRKDVPNTKEDLDAAGIRFVYFSAQNMKRSKPVAEKLGITFDWNCAISLRNLEEGHDPHRHISAYADWDVMARMPHGIEAIKEHIQNVDNVPLLVSLFTDATPHTIGSMVDVFRANGEVVLAVGAGYRSYNQQIYAAANLSTSVTYLPNIMPFIPSEEKDLFTLFPAFSQAGLTKADLRLFFDLTAVGTVNLLQLRSLDPALLLAPLLGGVSSLPPLSTLPRDETMTNVCADATRSTGTLTEHVHLSVLLETIRKGRVLLLNKQQAIAFVVIFLASFGGWNLLAQALPMTVAPVCPPPVALAFCLLYLPTLSLTMLFNDDHEHVMKNTPRKTALAPRSRDRRRFLKYLAVRVCAVCTALYATGFATAASVLSDGRGFLRSLSRFHSVFGHGLDSAGKIADARAFCLVQDMIANAALLALLGQALTLLVRGQRPLKDFPWPQYYKEYYASIAAVLGAHALFMALRSTLRNCGHHGPAARWLSGVDCAAAAADTSRVGYTDLDGWVWGVLLLGLLGNLTAGFVVNHYDGHFYRRYLQFLRLEFDTRLGMHSPR